MNTFLRRLDSRSESNGPWMTLAMLFELVVARGRSQVPELQRWPECSHGYLISSGLIHPGRGRVDRHYSIDEIAS
jgi:hypothetical protein